MVDVQLPAGLRPCHYVGTHNGPKTAWPPAAPQPGLSLVCHLKAQMAVSVLPTSMSAGPAFEHARCTRYAQLQGLERGGHKQGEMGARDPTAARGGR